MVVLMIIFSLWRDTFSGEMVYFDRFTAWGFQAFFFSAVILLYFQNKNVSLFSLLYWSSFIAALISVALLLIPSFDKWYETIQLDGYYEIYKNFEHRYRAYGIAENLTFTYGFIMGLFSGYSLLLIKKNALFIIPFFIFLLAAIFNARIGLVPILFFIFYSIFILQDYKLWFRFLLSLVVLTIFGYIYSLSIGKNLFDLSIFSNFKWVLNFFLDILGMTDSNEVSTLSIIFSKFIIIPDESLLQFLFGTGESLFGRESGSSDMGFILQLNYAGISFLVLIMLFIFFCTYRLIIMLGVTHWFTSFFFFLIIILNIKGFIFAATPGGRLIFLLYMYFILQKTTWKMKVI